MAVTYDRSNMEKTVSLRDAAVQLGKLVQDHKGVDVVVLDVTGRNSWADYFVIATVTSGAHSRGLQKNIYEQLKALDLEIHPARRKLPDGDEWTLIDLGPVIVHLMTPMARGFYDLEKLWFGAPNLLAE